MSDAYQWGSLASQNYQGIGQSLQGRLNNKSQFWRDLAGMLANIQDRGWQSGEAEKSRTFEAEQAGLLKEHQIGLTELEAKLRGEATEAEYGLRDKEATNQAARGKEAEDIEYSRKKALLDIDQKNALERMEKEAGYQAVRDATLAGYGIKEIQARLSADLATQQAEEPDFANVAEEYLVTVLPNRRQGQGFVNAGMYDWSVWQDPARVEEAVRDFQDWYSQNNQGQVAPRELVDYLRRMLASASEVGDVSGTDQTNSLTPDQNQIGLATLVDILSSVAKTPTLPGKVLAGGYALSKGLVGAAQNRQESTKASTWTESQKYY